jgi:hypothetical protein
MKRALNINSLVLLGILLCYAWPAHAIVVRTGVDPNSVVIPGDNDFFGALSMSGVVEVTNNVESCSGALIGNFSVLTAGHCVTSAFGAGLYTHPQVTFLVPGGYVVQDVSSIAVDPTWNGDFSLGGDLAVMQLSQAAPASATRYSLYTGMALPTSSPIVLAGFGLSGTGDAGANGYGYGSLRAGTNEYAVTGASFGWSSNVLIGQFYDVNHPSTNGLGLASPYSSSDEVTTAFGDSGGPTFYNGQIIGVHDVLICLTPKGSESCSVPPSVSIYNDSFYGQLWGDVSVAGNAAFIEGVPEPRSAVLTMLGLSLAGWRRWRSRGNRSRSSSH